jgi:hypothetical protein
MSDVSVVVVTLNAMPYIDQCLESVRGHETVVVDHGSTDGTVELVRERFPEVRLVEQENRGLAAGWNRGMAEVSREWFLILNADAWMREGAVERLVAFGEARPQAAVVGPRLRFPDGRLQRSVRGFPTLWRLATEYLFLRKLAPRSRLFNEFYGNGFAHSARRISSWAPACSCGVTRSTTSARWTRATSSSARKSTGATASGRAAGRSTSTRAPRRSTSTEPGTAAVCSASRSAGHVRFMAKHHGLAAAERTRRLLRYSLALRGLMFRGDRGRAYRDAARWLGSAPAATLAGVEA